MSTAGQRCRRGDVIGSALSIALSVALYASTPTAHAQASAQTEAVRQYSIPAGPLPKALSAWGAQSGKQLVFPPGLVAEKTSKGVSGRYTSGEALTRLLSGSGVAWEVMGDSTIVLKKAAVPAAPKPAPVPTSAAPAEEKITTMPEILVVGSRSMNADIRRTRDDVQPYVTFDAETIQRSQAPTLESFLKTRLPMNTVQITPTEQGFGTIANTAVNLRGLGTNQTLILLNGRRIPGNPSSGTLEQGSIAGIPTSSIERIEVLPATASGIYGGGATGGVINIITRSDYSGIDLSVSYGDSFRGDAPSHRVDASAGFSFEGGRSHALISATYSSSDPLFNADRDFVARSRALLLANNPAAFYGTAMPPIGYLTNIRSQDGANLVLKDGTALNSPITFVPAGYAGPASDGGLALAANAGLYDLGLADDSAGGRYSITRGLETRSVSVNLRRDFSDRIEAFVDLGWSDTDSHAFYANTPRTATLAADAPNNPFTSAVNVSFPMTGIPPLPILTSSESHRAVAGVIVQLSRGWTAGLDYVWSSAESSGSSSTDGIVAAANARDLVGNGTLDVLRDLNAFPLDWSPYYLALPGQLRGPDKATLNNVTFRLSGPLFQLPGGAVNLSSVADWRKDELEDTINSTRTQHTFLPSRSQTNLSFYSELRAPLVSSANALPLVRELELQAAVRHDEYETRSPVPASQVIPSRNGPFPDLPYNTNKVSATKYTVGFRYVPIEDIALRASYGTGFLPPAVQQISEAASTVFPASNTPIDPKRGNTRQLDPVEVFRGGRPDLTPEESTSFSAGIVLTPRAIPDLRLSFDYTWIEKKNEIATFDHQATVLNEDLLVGRVARAPLTEEDIALGYSGGIITSIDTTLVNVARTRVKAVDIQGDYTIRTDRFGDFNLYALATWQPTFERKITPAPDEPYLNSTGYDRGNLKWRGNAGIDWNAGSWSIGWNIQYYDSYFAYVAGSAPTTIDVIVGNQGSDRIPSQTYHDLLIGYRIRQHPNPLLDQLEITAGVQNIFDKHPPAIADLSYTGNYSQYGDPRLRRFMLTLKKHF